MLIAFLYCSLFLLCWVHLGLHQSPFGGFLRKVVVKDTRAQQVVSEPGSSWDRVLIPKASVVVWWRSCVDLGAAVGLFVGSCVDLKTMCGLLEESIRRSR